MSRFPFAREWGLSDDDSLMKSGAVDSLGILDLVGFIESEFEIEFDDDDLQGENFESIASLAVFIQSKCTAAS